MKLFTKIMKIQRYPDEVLDLYGVMYFDMLNELSSEKRVYKLVTIIIND